MALKKLPTQFYQNTVNSRTRSFSFAALVHLLCVCIAIPPTAMHSHAALAQSGGIPTDSPNGEEFDENSPLGLAERALIQGSQSRADSIRLLTEENRNLFYLNNQTLHTRSGEYVDDLTKIDLKRDPFNHAPGVLELALEVNIQGNALDISYKGANYLHRMTFPSQEAPIGMTFDNEFIFVLLKDGKRLIIDISSLQSQLFNSSIPAFIPGQYDLTKYPDETFEIRLIRRRLNTVDRSRRAALATLNRREDQRAQIFAHANAQLIGDLDTNLEKVRYIPLSDAVADAHPILDQGDLALVVGEGDKARIVDIETRATEIAELESQAGGLLALLALIHAESRNDLQKFEALMDEAKETIAGFLSTDEGLLRLMNSDLLELLAQISPELVAAIKSHAAKAVATSAERDRFTPEEWQQDSEYFESTVNQARELASERSPGKRALDQLALFSATRTRKLLSPANIRRLTSVLKGGSVAALAVGADHAFAQGEYTNISVELLAGSLHWLLHQFPVWLDDEYRPLLALSVASQAAIPAVIYGAAFIASKFTQLSAQQIPPTLGIRSFARLFQFPPFRVLATVTRQKAAFRAMKMGFVNAPVALSGPARQEGHNRINTSTRSRLYRRSVTNLIAYSTVAARQNIPLGEIAARAEGLDPTDSESLAIAMEIGREIEEQLRVLTVDQIEAEIRRDPEGFIKNLRVVRSALEVKDENGNIVTPSSAGQNQSEPQWLPLWKPYLMHSASLRILKWMVNYNDDLYKQLADALPDAFTCRLINRGYIIDYLISLASASSMGDWANLSNRQELHAQEGEFGWSHPKVTTENVQQSSIHLGRGSSTTYLIFSQGMGGANTAHKPAELKEFAEKQIPGVKPLTVESIETFLALFDFRSTQPGAMAFNIMKSGRIRLFQSTLAIGLLPRLLLGGQNFEAALQGQLMFMSSALWTFAWPWTFIYGAQENHEKRIESDWNMFQNIQVALNQSIRFRNQEGAELSIKAMTDLYDRDHFGDLSHPDLPTQGSDQDIFAYAQTLLDFSFKHPPVASRHSSLIANFWTVGASIATTVLATYFYTMTFQSQNLKWHGIDWTDWNFFARLPEGDGVDGLAIKSAMLTFGALGLQKFLNFGWDWLRLNAFTPENPIEEATLRQRYEESKESLVAPFRRLISSCSTAFSKGK